MLRPGKKQPLLPNGWLFTVFGTIHDSSTEHVRVPLFHPSKAECVIAEAAKIYFHQ